MVNNTFLQVSTFVLDEADTLTDDSFVERIEILLKRMAQAQIILVSATLPKTLPDVLQPYGEAMQHVITITLYFKWPFLEPTF